MIKSLTSLRGVFILFVFFHHCLNIYPGGGTLAVAFFFVLGGFSMTLGYKEIIIQPGFCYKDFLCRRCMKFYPLHWLCLLAVLPLALISFKVQQIPVFFVNAALLQSWIPNPSVYFSFNYVSWYLGNTLFFAVVFPPLIKWITTSGLSGRILIAFLFASFYTIVAILIPVEKYHAILYISPYMRLLDFVFGIYLALLYLKVKGHPAKWWNGNIISHIIILCLIFLLVVESCVLPEKATWFAPVYWLMIGAVIVIAAKINKNGGGNLLLENKYLQRLGELSFIIFMTHQIVMRYTTLIFNKILHLNNDIFYIFFTLLLTLVLSIMVDRYILKPVTRWLTKRIQPSTIARS